jgi:hypothetical protein
MTQFHPRCKMIVAIAASLAMSSSIAMAQSTYVGGTSGPATGDPSFPVEGNVGNGSYGSSVGAGNGTVSAGAGTTSNGQNQVYGTTIGTPSTSKETSTLPPACVAFPDIDLSTNWDNC